MGQKKTKNKPSAGQGSKSPAKVKRLPPSSDAARDEGPRLIPLGDHVSEPSRLEHYLELADAALDTVTAKVESKISGRTNETFNRKAD